VRMAAATSWGGVRTKASAIPLLCGLSRGVSALSINIGRCLLVEDFNFVSSASFV
jgi:hypothetical protein